MTVVYKFGGSSLATADHLRHAAGIIAEAQKEHQVVVVASAMGTSTDELVRLAFSLGGTTASREYDQLVATGEVLSVAALAIALEAIGCPAVSMSAEQAGIVAEGPPSEGRIRRIDTVAIEEQLANGKVPIVAGFQGINDGSVVTLGRGGSDTTAVALAVALGVDECTIFTDVSGVRSADPRVVDDTVVYSEISGDLMAEMAVAGARVLHSRAVDLAQAHGVALRIVDTADHRDAGTLIPARVRRQPDEDLAPTAVACDEDVARVLIKGPASVSERLAVRVLQVLGDVRTPIDLVARSGVGEEEFRMGFTMRNSDLERARVLVTRAVEAHAAELSIDTGVAKVSLIGHGLSGRPDITARFLSCCAALSVPTSWVSTTAMRISAVVPLDRANEVVAQIHREFGLSPASVLAGQGGELGA